MIVYFLNQNVRQQVYFSKSFRINSEKFSLTTSKERYIKNDKKVDNAQAV